MPAITATAPIAAKMVVKELPASSARSSRSRFTGWTVTVATGAMARATAPETSSGARRAAEDAAPVRHQQEPLGGLRAPSAGHRHPGDRAGGHEGVDALGVGLVAEPRDAHAGHDAAHRQRRAPAGREDPHAIARPHAEGPGGVLLEDHLAGPQGGREALEPGGARIPSEAARGRDIDLEHPQVGLGPARSGRRDRHAGGPDHGQHGGAGGQPVAHGRLGCRRAASRGPGRARPPARAPCARRPAPTRAGCRPRAGRR